MSGLGRGHIVLDGKDLNMKDFERRLYEALLIAFGKILAKYNVFAQGAILRDAGKEILDYHPCHNRYLR